MSFSKIKVLFRYGLIDLTKNMNVFIYVLMPILFALLYSGMDTMPKEFVFSLCMLLNLSMVPVALMGTIIAEEKEKNTLRTLMLNDVKAKEVMVAKALICLLFVVVNNILIYVIASLSMESFFLYQFFCILVSLAVIFFGACVGLMAKNQMSAGLLSMPFMFLLMAPLFMSMLKNEAFTKISSFLPTDAMMQSFEFVSQHTLSFSNLWRPLLVIFVWFIGSILLFQWIYKKVGVDN